MRNVNNQAPGLLFHRCRPRPKVPFVGTLRYSAPSVHMGREQGPASDMVSLVYLVAELVSGRLPWRSVLQPRKVLQLKQAFPASAEFRRLPHELRLLYREAMEVSAGGCWAVDGIRKRHVENLMLSLFKV